MFKVLSNELLAPDVYRMVVLAPRVALARKAGQFVIVRLGQGQERIPLTIADADAKAGTITLIIQAMGESTRLLTAVAPGGSIRDVAGPLGMPTEIRLWGKVVCVGGGVGTAVLFPMARALADAGNKVIAIIGGRTSKHVLLASELAEFCTEVMPCTDDGSAGKHGFVTEVLADVIADESTKPDAVFAVGPIGMMQAVAQMTKPEQIETIVSLNPIMVDGTGMCGGCRVTVGGETKFACVDGPEFDAHKVDFEELAQRLKTYDEHECRLGNVKFTGEEDEK